MRVRITHRLRGEIDGVPLDRFERGQVYDVNVSIATYLIVIGAAEPLAEIAPAKIVPINITEQLGTTAKRIRQRIERANKHR
jgi:hypothetical protein